MDWTHIVQIVSNRGFLGYYYGQFQEKELRTVHLISTEGGGAIVDSLLCICQCILDSPNHMDTIDNASLMPMLCISAFLDIFWTFQNLDVF